MWFRTAPSSVLSGIVALATTLATSAFAAPVSVTAAFGEGPVEFVVGEIALRNARIGDEYKASIAGLRLNGGSSSVKYEKVSGIDWVTVSEDGILSGTPVTSAQTSVTVKVTASDGSSAQLAATIQTKPAGAPILDELSVMSYNLWEGGTKVSNYHEKQVRFLVSSGADVVGFQESKGIHATRLGDALGWYSWQSSDVGVISKYPILQGKTHDTWAGYVKIAPGDGDERAVHLWNVHLAPYPYGPYDFCFDNKTVDEVLALEDESMRTPQIKSILKEMEPYLEAADDVPVLLLGDFNAPSHLDWVDDTREKHCGQGDMPWPTSVEPMEAGLVDSYRLAHPDPAADPGITWSPIYLENEGRPEPMDRIDFVYSKGSQLKLVQSETLVVGSPKPEPDHEDNEWTSDHAAVLTVYKFKDYSKRR